MGAVSAEDARERGELQRSYYSLLHATTYNELTGAPLTSATLRPEPCLTSWLEVLHAWAPTLAHRSA